MQTTFALIAAMAFVAPALAAPEGCMSTYSGKFEITAYNLSTVAKRNIEKRACDTPGSLTITLNNGILIDSKGRTGYVAANHQFQFDSPVQAGALSKSGWSVCSNGSLALGNSNVFYQCPSGNPDGGDQGAFYNLYDDMAFDICFPAAINVLPCGSSGGAVSQQPDGQPTGASATAPVSQISDGQPQAPSGMPITQISDGQVQMPTGMPISQISDGQIQQGTSTAAPISQISDGQIQQGTSTAAPISQISDGQIQQGTSTAAPISQISDGQIQQGTSTAAPISQISDGQIQQGTSTAAPISQISDGQIQQGTSTAVAAISQITDGQIQSPTGTGNSSTPIPFTGSATAIKASLFTILAGAIAVAFL